MRRARPPGDGGGFGRQIWLGTLFVNLLLVGFVAVIVVEGRRDAESDARFLTENYGRILEENVAAVIGKADVTLGNVVDELRREQAQGGLRRPQFEAFLAQQDGRLPESVGLRVSDAAGVIRYAVSGVQAQTVSIADRPYFLRLRNDGDAGLVIAEPALGRVSLQWTVTLARRYDNADGSFAGVVVVPIPTAYFLARLAGLDLGAQGNSGLWTRTTLVARHSKADSRGTTTGSTTPSPQLKALLGSDTAATFYHAVSGVDGISRAYHFRRVGDYPLFLVVGLAEDDYLADWREATRRNVAIALAFVVATLLFARVAQRGWQGQLAAQRRLEETNAALTASEDQFRYLFEHSPVAKSMTEVAGRVHANPALCRLLGYTAEEMQQRSWQSLTHPDDIAETERAMASLLRGETASVRYVKRFLRKDGGVVWGDVSSALRRDSEGAPRHFLTVVSDITERKQAEEALAAALQFNKDLIRTMQDGFSVLDDRGRAVDANPAFCRMTGFSREELVGVGAPHPYWPPEELEHIGAAFQATLEDRASDLELTFMRKNGERFPVIVSPSTLRDDHGDITGYTATVKDISERKRAEAELAKYRGHLEELVEQRTAALSRTETRAGKILEASAAGLYGVDVEGRITFINPAACALLGCTAAAVLGGDAHRLFHHSRPDGSPYPREECPSQQALRSGTLVRSDSETYWRADGRPLPVMCATHPMVEDGRIIGAVTSLVDVSEQRAAAAARDQALLAAEKLARLRSEFLANMSHEIRTPLNGVLGFAELGGRNCEDAAKARNAFEKILVSGKRLLGVINEILDFSKIEAGRLQVEAVPVDLAAAIHQAVDVVREAARAKHLAVHVTLAADLPGFARGDPLRLGQVLLNLLDNAVKFTPAGSVSLAASRQDDRLVFEVADTGIGMNAEQLAGLFNPFQQGDGSITRKFGGSGLGLAIAKHLVELMGGAIHVDSQPGAGSHFAFWLPYVPAALPPAGPPPDDGQLSGDRPLAGIRVLAVEDEPINQVILEAMLSEAGATVTTAGNGLEAVERLAREGAAAYDIVLMDVQMPVLDGLAATRRMLAMAPDLAIVGQTAYAMSDEKARCLAAGMVDHIAKPIESAVLIATVLRHAARPRREAAKSPA
jgi:PAS domain S-box-containing protein